MASCELLVKTGVKDVMLPCSTFVKPHDLVTRARSVMRTSGLRTLPVIDDDNRLAGIITARQLLRVTSTRSNIPVSGLMLTPRLVATSIDNLSKLVKEMIELDISLVPVVKSSDDQTVSGVVRLDDVLPYIARSLKSSKLTVGDIMVKDVATCSPDDEIAKVWYIMEDKCCSGLPVTRYNREKHEDEVVGMITRADIIRSGATRLGEESDKGHFRSPPRVHSLMRTPAIVVKSNMPLSDAVDLMLKRKIGRLPVVDQGKLMGMITRGDAVETCI
jgi:CBS domain-containing protein